MTIAWVFQTNGHLTPAGVVLAFVLLAVLCLGFPALLVSLPGNSKME